MSTRERESLAHTPRLRPGGFVDHLPTAEARACFAAWRAARRGAELPELHAFAPHRLPRGMVPWLLLQRLRADGEIVYGLAGEEVTRWFGATPKGRPVLDHVDAAERAPRLALVRRAMRSGLPVWFAGRLLFENRDHVAVGRLCLPAVDAGERVLLLIYFVLGKRPGPDLRVIGQPAFDADEAVWCRPEELA